MPFQRADFAPFSLDPGTTMGARSAETEGRLAKFTSRKADLKKRVGEADVIIADRAAQYRALRLPPIPDRQAEILGALDVANLLRHDLMVVGTNAFIACPLYVPDPRWMALQKLWLANKAEHNALKRPKYHRQGIVLLSSLPILSGRCVPDEHRLCAEAASGTA